MKTKDAFGLDRLYDDLYFANGFEYIPTYATRVPDYFADEQKRLDYLDSRDWRVEEIILAYLDGGEIKIVDRDNRSNFELQHSNIKKCKKRIARNKEIFKRISRHMLRLRKYEKKILKAILKEGLTDDLKNKGNRVQILLASYDWLIELFARYEIILHDDREELNTVALKLYRKEFGDRLRQARIAKKLTVEEVANKINLTRVGYGYYELGQRDPSPAAIYILAQMFGVSADWLLGLK